MDLVKSKRTVYIFSAQGTKGDIFPMVAIAKELIERKRKVVFLANDIYQEKIEQEGIEFVSIGTADIYEATFMNKFMWSPVFDFREYCYKDYMEPAIKSGYEYVSQLAEDGRLKLHIIGLPSEFCGAFLAAEKYNIPVTIFYLSPSAINSLLKPPAPLKWVFPRWYPSFLLRKRLMKIRREFKEIQLDKLYFKQYNKLRVSYKLPIQDGLIGFNLDVLEPKRIGLFPGWFGMPARDWPVDLRLVGFPLFDAVCEKKRTDFDVFVETYGKPIVFTCGTGMFDYKRVFSICKQICKNLRMSGLFVGPNLESKIENDGVGLMYTNYVDFTYAFKKSQLVVHHGGIGTTAQAIKAGIPQLIRPITFDQPDNADRIKRLGLGDYLFIHNFTVNEAEKKINQLLSSRRVKKLLEYYSVLLSESDAARDAIDLILNDNYVEKFKKAPGFS